MDFARYARTVTLLVRDESLTETMSRYLIGQIQATENVEVRLRTIVVEAHGEAISVPAEIDVVEVARIDRAPTRNPVNLPSQLPCR